jgi:hypothetical protein
MSLKTFHILFITISILLTLAFGDWWLRLFIAMGKPLYGLLSVLSLAVVAALFGYLGWFVAKAQSTLK